ncbi:carboxypeptidase regulatory-like domain-containing protein [Botrimarina mediterranea]|uniref:carboxypeptidase regulatory-like domain-containing protein n=1 Tax=Botrimarina mediterranea TaxID=2528022 RepID=UPI00119EFA51|nr:carboxypeptidase regulatory-like domain-containing protein [Botrimarina mediterranea]
MVDQELAASAVEVLGAASELVVNWLLQSTLLLTAGLALGHALRRRGSAVQSAVYRTTLVAVIACPMATWGLSLAGVSGWSVELPALMAQAEPTTPEAEPVATPPQEPTAPVPVPLGSAPAAVEFSAVAALAPLPVPPLAASQDSDSSRLPSSDRFLASSVGPPATSSPTPALTVFGAVAIGAAVLWFVVSGVLLARLALAWRALLRLRSASTVADEPTHRLCSELATQLGVATPQVLRSPYLPSPCLAGIRRPAVLLPEEHDGTSLQDVLVHELAHLKRHDTGWNLARRLSTSAMFFQPLLWSLSRRIEAAAEEVCDDYVVQLGSDRTDYADRLVSIAELGATPIAAAGVGIVSFRSMLGRRVVRILDTSRPLSTRVGNLLLALVIGGGLVGATMAGLVGLNSAVSKASAALTEEVAGADQELSSDDVADDDTPSEEKVVTVEGRVVDPAGRPFAGATVEAQRWIHDPDASKSPLATTTSDESGRFTLRYPRHEQPTLVASAPGFGPASVASDPAKAKEAPTLQLAADDIAIRGRVLDEEGEPVAGATLRVKGVAAPATTNLDAWLAALRRGVIIWEAVGKHIESWTPQAPGTLARPIVTGADGAFVIKGVGSERVVRATLEGPTIAFTQLTIATREMTPVVAVDGMPDPDWSREHTVYGAECQVVVAATQPIEGVVRDAKTGEPLAGVAVESYRMREYDTSARREIRTQSDARGRYRLVGMPKDVGRQIIAVPNDSQPYLMREFDVPDRSGLGPVDLDLELYRGVWITGRIIDRETQRPVGLPVIVLAHQYPYLANPFAQALPEYDSDGNIAGYQHRYTVDENGRFRLVGIPGKGIVGLVVGSALPSPIGQGSDQISGANESGHFSTYRHGAGASTKHPTIMREVEVHDGADEFVVDFELDRGASIRVTPLGPDGEVVTMLRVAGLAHREFWETPEGSPFDVSALAKGEERTLMIQSEELGVGKALRISEAQSPDEITVTLEPCVTVRGRVIDENDAPLSGARVRLHPLPGGDYSPELDTVSTDEEGRFEHGGVLCGTTYNVYLESKEQGFATLAEKLAVHPGETIDLGYIDVTNDERPEPVREAMAAAAGIAPKGDVAAVEFAGKVVDPDGKPVAGAELYYVFYVPKATGVLDSAFKPIATTDAQGDFRFQAAPSDFGPKATEREFKAASIVASRTGFGFAISTAARFEATGEWQSEAVERVKGLPEPFREQAETMLGAAGKPLQLARDEAPIRGRILDINGKPVAGARLSLDRIWCSADDDLTAWREAAAQPKADFYSARMTTPRMVSDWQIRTAVPSTTTDSEGRFTLRGIGQGRIARLQLEGPGVETNLVLARTEAGEPIELVEEQSRPDARRLTYYPAEFSYVVGPSTPISGVVRDEETKQPLAGVTIKSQKRHGNELNGWGADFVRTVTDQQGRYTLNGMPIGADNRIAAIAPEGDIAYFSSARLANTESVDSPLEVDFELHRGIWLEGRITDKRTGDGIAGHIAYYVPPENPDHRFARSLQVDERDRLLADDKGRYRIAVLPGHGYVTFQAYQHERYPRATEILKPDGSREAAEPMIRCEPSYLMPSSYHEVAEIDPASEATRIELNLELDSGTTVAGRVVGPDGEPITSFRYTNRIAEFASSWNRASDGQFELVGYEPDQPRHVYAMDLQRNLAGRVVVAGAAPEDLVVKLQPAGKATGRLLDTEGEPLANCTLTAWHLRNADDFGTFNKSYQAPPLPANRESNSNAIYETDDGGRFEIACLVPGIDYRLNAYDPAAMSSSTAAAMRFQSGPVDVVIRVESGQTLDVGDVRLAADEKEFAKRATQPEQAAVKPASAATADTAWADPVEVEAKGNQAKQESGVVVGPDGKPIAGAEFLYFHTRVHDIEPMKPRLLATTDDQGRFRFPAPVVELPKDAPASWSYSQWIVVRAPGYGFAVERPGYLGKSRPRPQPVTVTVIGAALSALASQTVIELPAEGEPLRGRVIDIDGNPVAGATIKTRWSRRANDPAGPWYGAKGDTQPNAEWRSKVFDLLNIIEPPLTTLALPAATTNADGRFALRGIEDNLLLQLVIEGEGIETAEVVARNMPGEKIEFTIDEGVGETSYTIHPNDLLHVAAPSRPVEGRVVDYQTGEPIAGVIVRDGMIHGTNRWSSLDDRQFVTRTDADGRYRITGLPVGDKNRVMAFTDGDAAYVPAIVTADTSAAAEQGASDFRLRRGVWAEGRVYDADTDEAIVGSLGYYYFPNKEVDESYPGTRRTFVQGRYWTDAEGRFRIPVLPTRGVLAFRYDNNAANGPLGRDIDRYPRGAGAEAIEGRDERGWFATEPHYLMPIDYQRLVEVDPSPEDKSIRADMPLTASTSVTVTVPSVGGLFTTGYRSYGAAEMWGWQRQESPQFQVEGLKVGERRQVLVYDESRNRVGATTVTEKDQDVVIEWVPAGKFTGRLIDPDGEPITDATLQLDLEAFNRGEVAAWAPHPGKVSNPETIPVDTEGRFTLHGIHHEKKYSAWVSAPRSFNGMMRQPMLVGKALVNAAIEPGEVKDLGDIVIGGDDKDSEDKAAKPAEEDKPAEEKKPAEKPAEKPEPTQAAEAAKNLWGKVTLADGQPAAGAHVALVAMRKVTNKGGDYSPNGVVLAEGTADEAGAFRLTHSADSKLFHYSKLLVRRDGAAVASKYVSLDHENDALYLELPAEQPILARLVDIEGQPAAGVTVRPRFVMEAAKPGREPAGAGYSGEGAGPAAWIQPVVSDAEGRFTLHGVPVGYGAYLEVDGDDRFAPQQISLNTRQPEQRGERDGTYRSLVRNGKPGEELLLPLAPAQVFEGTVTYADTGEPAPLARVTIWASQQKEYGSMVSVAGQADEKGRFRISPKSGVRFGINAYAPEGTPYLARQTPTEKGIHWNDGDRVKQVDVTLPRGVLITGQVVEVGTGQPIADASVQYVPERNNNPNVADDILTGWQAIQTTDTEGRFETAVLPGPGRIVVHGPTDDYVIAESTSQELSRNKKGGRRQYAHHFDRIDVTAEDSPVEMTVRLTRGGVANGRLVDEAGAPVNGALMVSWRNIHATDLAWRGHSPPVEGARFEVRGLPSEAEHTVHFLAQEQKLGATVAVRAGDVGERVTLEPCGSVTARLVDESGDPVANFSGVSVYLVVRPGPDPLNNPESGREVVSADSDFISNVDRTNYPDVRATDTDADGRLRLPVLIPGASYRIVALKDGGFITLKDFQAKANEELDLGDLTIDIEVDQ